MNTDCNPNTNGIRILLYQNRAAAPLAEYLTLRGYTVTEVSAQNVKEKIYKGNYDLALLDHFESAAPDSLELVQYQRRIDRRKPILVVSCQFEREYAVKAFREGADDYLTRPYNYEELACRIKAILKRCGLSVREPHEEYSIAGFTFNSKCSVLSVDGKDVKLPKKEGQVLAVLCEYKNQVVPADAVLDYVWGSVDVFSKRSFDVYICSLRKRLKNTGSEIETLGRGQYRLKAAE